MDGRYETIQIRRNRKMLERLIKNRQYDQKTNQFYTRGRYIRFSDGTVFYAKRELIDGKKIEAFQSLWRFLIRKRLPAGMLREACWDYADLENSCRTEVFMALAHTFDPKVAFDRLGPPAWEAHKRNDPGGFLKFVQRVFVTRRIENFLRRNQWKHHPQQVGGVTVGIGIFQPTLREESHVPAPLMSDIDSLEEILESKGPEAVKEYFNGLPEDKKESLVEILMKRCDTEQNNALMAAQGL